MSTVYVSTLFFNIHDRVDMEGDVFIITKIQIPGFFIYFMSNNKEKGAPFFSRPSIITFITF